MTTWIDEAERLAKAATPGPWIAEVDRFDDEEGWGVIVTDKPGVNVFFWGPCDDGITMKPAEVRETRQWLNGQHIAHWSPDRALKVLAALRAAEALTPYANAEFVALRAALAAALEAP